MKAAGCSEDECSNLTLQKRIQRQIQQILHPPKSPVPKRGVVHVGESVTTIVTENEQHIIKQAILAQEQKYKIQKKYLMQRRQLLVNQRDVVLLIE